jgi:hypothetical protein
MKVSISLLLIIGLAASCTQSRQEKTFENISYVAKSTFETDISLGILKIYYPAYSPMNINAANSNLNAKGIYVIGYGDLVQSTLLYEYQTEYNKNADAWLQKHRQTDIETLLKDFKNK